MFEGPVLASTEPGILFEIIEKIASMASPFLSVLSFPLPGSDHARIGLGGDSGALSGRSYGTHLGDPAPRRRMG